MRYPSTFVALMLNRLLKACGFRQSGKSQVLVWSKESRCRPRIGSTIVRLTANVQNLPFQETPETPETPETLDQELSDCAEKSPASSPGDRDSAQETIFPGKWDEEKGCQ
jgi:hypothetical protein